jgi:deoxyribodipyrimidine photo-lyase
MNLQRSIKTPINIFWFRRDLRLEDNHGLYMALKGGLPVLPLFIFDKNILDQLENKRDPRVTFIYNSLDQLNQDLIKKGSSILIRIGNPINIWTSLVSEFQIHSVYINHDYEPYAIDRDKKIYEILKENGNFLHTFKDQVIFEKKEILSGSGSPYKVYTPYMKKWINQLSIKHIEPFPSESENKNFVQHIFTFPKMNEIGFEKSDRSFPAKYVDEEIISKYDQTRNFPEILGTSRLGIHLRFGTVSIRKMVRQALILNEIWLQELVWREFFMMILYNFPYVLRKPFRKKYSQLTYLNDEDLFTRWCEGKTGYPLVDAGMRELNTTGFMHNRVRMVTASFLSKHLLIDWRWGEEYFAQKLLDFELASNNGNWQWVAGCGCDAAPYFRIFNPIEQAKKFDPEQRYIREWIPEFRSDKYPKPIVDHKYARERALTFYEVIKN